MKTPVAIFIIMAAAFVIGSLAHSGKRPGMMMNGGMTGRSSESQASQFSVNPGDADALLAYIQGNKLPCAQCHTVSGNGTGPSFATVSASYANREEAESVLEDHIAHGFGRMPGGFASNSESAHLAKLILNLARSNAR